MFNIIHKSAEPPPEWASLIIRLLHKKGSKQLISNFRPLALISNVCKLYMSVLTVRLTMVVEHRQYLGEMQNGFRAERGTSDNLVVLSQMIEHNRSAKKPLYAAFLDLEKAYDSIEWDVVWQTLAQLDIDARFIDLLKNLYHGSVCDIKLGQLVADNVPIRRGVRQGCILSPLLFALVMCLLTQRLESSGEGADFLTRKLAGLLYADDLVLFGNSVKDIQSLLDIAHDFTGEVGMKFSSTKCKIMVFDLRGSVDGNPNIHLGGVRLDVVNSYTYLGVQFSNSANYLDLFEQRIINRAAYYFYDIKRRADASFSIYAVGRTLWKSLAVPALTYGLDCLVVRKAVINKLQVYQNKMARVCLRSTSFAAVDALQGECGWSSFDYRVRRSRIATAHRLRHGPNQLVHSVIHAGTSRWMKQVAKDTIFFSIHDVVWPTTKTITEWVKRRANQNETETWITRMREKATLEVYRYNAEISDKCLLYDNHPGSRLLFQFRTNSFATNKRIGRFENKTPDIFATLCPSCTSWDSEDEAHILVECPAYKLVRTKWFDDVAKFTSEFHTLNTRGKARVGLLLNNLTDAKERADLTKYSLVRFVNTRKKNIKHGAIKGFRYGFFVLFWLMRAVFKIFFLLSLASRISVG